MIKPTHLRSTPLPKPKACKKCGSERIRRPGGQVVCPECKAKYMKSYAENHRSALLEYYQKRYKRNRENLLGQQKVYYTNNRIKITTRERMRWSGFPPEYKIWRGMIARCTVTSNGSYFRYGGRGISVCDRWRYSYDNFFEDMGPRPSPEYSIEREDVNGNYEPNNCRWATAQEQANNRTNTVSNRIDVSDNAPLSYDNRVMTLREFSELTGIPLIVVKYRYSQHAIPHWIIESEIDNRFYEYNGHRYTVVELALMHPEPFSKISYIQMSQRLKKYGWSVERAMETLYR